MDILIAEPATSVLYQNNFVEIGHSSPQSLLTIVWKRQISFEERVAGYKVAFEFVRDLEVTNLLVNNEKIFLFTALEKDWLAASFSSWVKQTCVKKFALVTSDLYKNMTDFSEYVNSIKNTNSRLAEVKHEFFLDQELALNWLSSEEKTEYSVAS